MDNQSAASQSTPFYNESGINFRSPGAGTITAGDVGSSASAAPGRATGSIQSDTSSPLDFSLGGGSSVLPWIIAISVALVALVIVALKK